MAGGNTISTLKNWIVAFLFIIPLIAVDAGAVQTENKILPDEYEYVKAVFKQYPLQQAVDTLCEKGVSAANVIKGAKKANHTDEEITKALLRSSLPRETAILEALQSDMAVALVMKSLLEQGVVPETVLRLSSENNLEINKFVSICRFLLDSGFSAPQLIELLFKAGTERDTIFLLAQRLDIPPATVVDVYVKYFDNPGKFGHVFVRYSLPQQANIQIGLPRVHDDKRKCCISPMNP